MRKRYLGAAGAAAAATGIALAAVLSTSGTAMATTTVELNETCQAKEPLSGDPFIISTTFAGSAPATATAGAVVTGTGVAQPWTVPSDIAHAPVKEVRDFAIKLSVSNATVLNATLSGGSNLGPGTPTVTRSGSTVTVNVPGPLTPGSIVQLPAINFTMKAGASGTIKTSLAGTGYDDPGITVTGIVNQAGNELTGPATCYAQSGAALTSTVIR